AVMPCRDFVYVLNQRDEPLLGRMGHVVLHEYEKSGYPISTEVFEIADQGLRAIGDFQKAPAAEAAPEPDGDAMKTIRYRGGVVTFRIPAHWTEEYQEDGGGVFYDEDNDNGTLRLNILTFSSKTPVTSRTAMSLLEPRREEYHGELTDLGHGNALLRYTEQTEEAGDPLTIHYWQIANVVPPNHFRLAIFSYTVPTELADDQDCGRGRGDDGTGTAGVHVRRGTGRVMLHGSENSSPARQPIPLAASRRSPCWAVAI